MKKSKWAVALCFIAIFGLVGCDDDDDPPRFPNPGDTTIDDPAQFEAEFNQLMQGVVIPIIQTIGTFNPFNPVVMASQMGGSAVLGAPCDDLTDELGCVSGMVESCPTGEGEATITFSSCQTMEGYTINGTVIASETETAAAAEWNVNVDGTPVGNITFLGTVDLTEGTSSIVVDLDMQANFDVGSATLIGTLSSSDVGDGCVLQDTDDLELIAPGLMFVLDGGLTFCGPESWPDGARTAIIIDATSDYRYEMVWVSDDEEVTTSVRDNSSNVLLAVCTTDLSTPPYPSTCDVLD